MTAGSDTPIPNPRAALDAARVVFGPPNFAAAPLLWQTAQQVLQGLLGRPELTGQALVAEARRQQRLTLSDANALVALSAWADRSGAAPTNEAERLIVREAWMALDHAVPDVSPVSPYAPPASPSFSSPYAPPLPPAGTPTAARPAERAWAPPSPAETAAHGQAEDVPAPVAPHRRRFLLVIGAVLVLVVGAGGGAWWYAGRADRALAAGIDAYQRGARETARMAFARAALLDEGDARPLVYLGRLSREAGDLAPARQFLTRAVRLAPGSAIAARELASLMLADGQPEIARRFYVRALEIDPTDRTAQGFLGCALFRLQRFDEARRWLDRAGPGDWQQCVPAIPITPSLPGYPPPPPA